MSADDEASQPAHLPRPRPRAVHSVGEHGDDRASLQHALEATGLALWTWDLINQRLTWAPPPSWLGGSEPDPNRTPGFFIDRDVHPDDRPKLHAALAAAVSDGALLDVEFRIMLPGRPVRWLLSRGTIVRDGAGTAVRMTGILLDVTDRALARSEHARLLHLERRVSRRAAALQRVAAALSDAATTEEVAAVMVEESLRSLGADAARLELRRSEPSAGEAHGQRDLIVRAAGTARLLADPPVAVHPTNAGVDVETSAGRIRVAVTLETRGRHRGRWSLAWVDRPDAETVPDAEPATGRLQWSAADWTSPGALDLLRTLATECAQALDRAELYEHQRDIATVLQRTLLPSVLPDVAGAEVAARYQPGAQGVDVGGDWYDVIALPEGRIGLVIGDVEGHSAAAAAVMGQVRNALRAYAVEGSTPASVMERVNRLLTRLRVNRLVSCCYLEFAPTEGTATSVLAGHPPPLLVRADGDCSFLPAQANLVLGVDDAARYVETTVLLDPGDCLLLYTDGLVETISRSLPDGLAALQRWATGCDIEDSPDELVERLVRLARDGRPVLDDVAVLALRYRPTARVRARRARTVRRTFPLDPMSASAARRFVADVLGQWQLEDHTPQVTLMASELVTNSVLHTSGELELALHVDGHRLRVEVLDHSERLPTLQHPDAEAPGGRGLLIIETLANRWGVELRANGKAVWFELLLDTAAPATCAG